MVYDLFIKNLPVITLFIGLVWEAASKSSTLKQQGKDLIEQKKSFDKRIDDLIISHKKDIQDVKTNFSKELSDLKENIEKEDSRSEKRQDKFGTDLHRYNRNTQEVINDMKEKQIGPLEGKVKSLEKSDDQQNEFYRNMQSHVGKIYDEIHQLALLVAKGLPNES